MGIQILGHYNAIDISNGVVQSQRSEYLDFMRGGVIFLMLLGHCIQYCTPSQMDFFENPIFKFIYSFHMPLFMIISGYLLGKALLSKDNLYEYGGKRIIQLFHPLIMGGILNYIIILIGRLIFSHTIQLADIFNLYKIAYVISSIWFLWSIISGTVAIIISFEITNNKYLRLLLLIVLTPIVLLFPNPAQNFYMYPILVIGVFSSYYKILNRIKRNKCLNSICILSFIIFLSVIDKKHLAISSIYNEQISFYENFVIHLIRVLSGILGSISFLIVGKYLFTHSIYKLRTLFMFLGRKSLQVYILSCSLLSVYLGYFMDAIYRRVPTLLHGMIEYPVILNFSLAVLWSVLYVYLLSSIIKIIESKKISYYIFGR